MVDEITNHELTKECILLVTTSSSLRSLGRRSRSRIEDLEEQKRN